MVDFRYYLNRQGPRGQQGVKGEQGYSPQVTVGKNTASEFTLKVINEDGSFETENLKVVPENRGGTYVRYDKDTYQEYIGDPDIATTRTFGVVRLATKEDLGTQEESRAVTSALLNTYLQENYLNKVHGDVVTGSVSFRGDTGFLNAPHIDKIKDELNNQYITRNVSNDTTEVGSLTIPDDITARIVQGSKEIAYTSDLAEFVTNAVLNNAISNLVTLDTDQQISGKKNFANGISLNSVIQFNVPTALIKGDKSSLDIILGAYDDRLMIGSQNTRPIKLNSNSITDYNGNNLLSYANIVAGDNITIEKTTEGVKISSTGGGGSSINDGSITSVSTWSSSKINSEITTAVDTINSTKNDNIFDLSKFTVVGSPTFTDDGIASGFSTSNYLKIPSINFNSKKWKVSLRFLFNTLSATNTLCGTANNKKISLSLFTNNKLNFENQMSKWFAVTSDILQLNTLYDTEFGQYIDGANCISYLSYKTANSQDFITKTVIKDASFYLATQEILSIGQYLNYNPASQCSIDLKQFSITVDGKEVFNGLMESTKPIYDKIATTSTALSTFQTDTDNNFSAVNSALNEKANLSDLAGYVTVNKYNELLARVVALEAQIDGGIA